MQFFALLSSPNRLSAATTSCYNHGMLVLADGTLKMLQIILIAFVRVEEGMRETKAQDLPRIFELARIDRQRG